LREVQRAAFTAELPVTEAVRFGRLHCAEALLFGNQDVSVAAKSEDFGQRSTAMSLITDIVSSVKPLRHAMKHLAACPTSHSATSEHVHSSCGYNDNAKPRLSV